MNVIAELEKLNGEQEYDPGIVHYFGGGVYARRGNLRKGFTIEKHAHSYDHLSILGSGKVLLITEGKEPEEIVGPACIEIKKDTKHAIVALEDSVWFCVHATEFPDVDDLHTIKIGESNETI